MKQTPRRWHIAVFLAPAIAVYSVILVFPLALSLAQSFYSTQNNTEHFAGVTNYVRLFNDPRWSTGFYNALVNNVAFFAIHMAIQNPVGIALAAMLSSRSVRFGSFFRSAFFFPTILSFVIVGFVWKLILSPLWGVTPALLAEIGAGGLFDAWLGKKETALMTLGLISVWQYVGVPMMLVYAALLAIPQEVLESAECEGIVGLSQFWKIKLPLVLPTIGMISILTFVGNFNAFDLVYVVQGAIAGPEASTDILGTYLYRAFFGFQMQQGDPNMGAAIAVTILMIVLSVVAVYLWLVQSRLRRYQF